MRRCFVFLILWLVGCRAQIQHGLEERDANEVASVLAARGFDARKVLEKGKRPTWAIDVDDARAIDAMRVLTELKLPRPQKLTTQRIAAETSLIETPGTERMRQLEALEGDLEQALELMDGVTSAAVEIVVPPVPRIGAPPVPSKASVLLRIRGDALERIDRQRAELRALVAGSVDGLRGDDVVLVIDEVQPALVTPPMASRETMLRMIIIALATLLSLLAVVLIATTLRGRRPAPKPARTEPAVVENTPVQKPSRPVVATGLQRRVA